MPNSLQQSNNPAGSSSDQSLSWEVVKMAQDAVVRGQQTEEKVNRMPFELITYISGFIGVLAYLGIEIKLLQEATNIFTFISLSLFSLGAILLLPFFLILLGKHEDHKDIEKLLPMLIIIIGLLIIGSIYTAYLSQGFKQTNIIEEIQKLKDEISILKDQNNKNAIILVPQVSSFIQSSSGAVTN